MLMPTLARHNGVEVTDEAAAEGKLGVRRRPRYIGARGPVLIKRLALCRPPGKNRPVIGAVFFEAFTLTVNGLYLPEGGGLHGAPRRLVYIHIMRVVAADPHPLGELVISQTVTIVIDAERTKG